MEQNYQIPIEQKNEEMRRRAMMEANQPAEPTPYDSELYKYSKYLVEIEGIPPQIKEMLWSPVNKLHSLTNLKTDDITFLMREHDCILSLARTSIPEHEYTDSIDLSLEQLRMTFFSMVKKAEEGFERKMQATQIRQISYTQDDRSMDRSGGGNFVSRLFKGGRR